MPTTNPRIAITLPPHRHDLLRRLAALQGVSMAGLVAELLNEFYPVLERVCVALEMAQRAQATSKEGIREAAEKAQAEIQPMLDSSMAQFDMFMNALQDGLKSQEGVGEGVPASGGESPRTALLAEGASPRVVTRGSGKKTVEPSNRGKPSQGKALKGVGQGGAKK